MMDRLFTNNEETCTGSRSSVILPASTLDRSRMSLISESRCLPLLKMSPMNPRCLIGHLAHQAVPEHLGEADDGVERRPQLVRHVGEELRLHPARVFQLDVLLLQRLLEALQLGHVARRGEHALQAPVAVVERGRVVGHHGELAVPGARGELVVGDLAFVQHAVDAGLGPAGSVK